MITFLLNVFVIIPEVNVEVVTPFATASSQTMEPQIKANKIPAQIQSETLSNLTVQIKVTQFTLLDIGSNTRGPLLDNSFLCNVNTFPSFTLPSHNLPTGIPPLTDNTTLQ